MRVSINLLLKLECDYKIEKRKKQELEKYLSPQDETKVKNVDVDSGKTKNGDEQIWKACKRAMVLLRWHVRLFS